MSARFAGSYHSRRTGGLLKGISFKSDLSARPIGAVERRVEPGRPGSRQYHPSSVLRIRLHKVICQRKPEISDARTRSCACLPVWIGPNSTYFIRGIDASHAGRGGDTLASIEKPLTISRPPAIARSLL